MVKHSKNEIPNFQTPMSLHVCIYIYLLLNWWSCLVYAWFPYYSPTYVGETSISACFNVFLSSTGRLICLDNQLPHFLGPHTSKKLQNTTTSDPSMSHFPKITMSFFWEWLKADNLIMGFLRLNHQPDEDDNPFTFFFNVPNNKT